MHVRKYLIHGGIYANRYRFPPAGEERKRSGRRVFLVARVQSFIRLLTRENLL